MKLLLGYSSSEKSSQYVIFLYNIEYVKCIMQTANLRKVGGSVMLAVPPAILDLLHLQAGATVRMAVESGCLVIEPLPRPRYSLDELLAQCDASVELSSEDREWLDSKPVGSELI
jgi:antitoxin ChpS